MTTLINNRYEVKGKLGEGGMGKVFIAYDRLTGDTVALKLVNPSETTDEGTTESRASATEHLQRRVALAREFQVLASLRHPHIISVLDYGFSAIDDNQQHQPYLTMELLSSAEPYLHYGSQLASLQAKLTLTNQLLEALSYLHRRGILHRDLKPANVLVTPNGLLKVLDFGIAAEVGQEEAAAGTLLYMAPEVLAGDQPQRASDLYAVGVMLYELLSGRHPFSSDATWQIINAIMNDEPDLGPIEMLKLAEQTANTPAVQSAQQVSDNAASAAKPDAATTVVNTSSPSISGDEQLDHTVVPGKGTSILDQAHTIKVDVPEVNAEEPTRRIPLSELDRTIVGATLETKNAQPSSEQGTVEKTTVPNASLPPVERSILVDVLAHLLAKKPQARYDNAEQVIHLLELAMGQPRSMESLEIRESYLQAARFVGRMAELSTLEASLVAAVDGKGSAWLIGGESGVGKSRLLDELRTRALVRNVQVLRGQMTQNTGMPYQLWREPLRRLLLMSEIDDQDATVLRDILPDIERLLRRQVKQSTSVEAGAYQQRLFGIVANLIQAVNTPILFLLEDLQWATESLKLLSHLTAMIHDLPVMIVATYRSDERAALPQEITGMQTMSLERLSQNDIAALSQSILGEAGNRPEIIGYLQRETEGNIFFMVEMIRALADEAGRLEKVATMALPPTLVVGGINAVLQRRLACIAPEEQPLLELAAVSGRELDLKVLGQLEDDTLPELQGWLVRASNCAVLEVRNEAWQFAHEKLRVAILDRIPSDKLPSLHRTIATAMDVVYDDAPEHAAATANHWRQAGDAAREFAAVEKAAAYGLRIGVFSEAKHWYARGLYLLSSLSLPKAERNTIEARLRLKAGETDYYLDDYAAALTQLEQALKLYRALKDKAGIVQVLNTLADVRWRQGEYAEALKLCNESLGLAREIGDAPGEARALNRLGMVNVEQGDYQAALQHLEKSVQIAQQLDDPNLSINPVNNLAVVAFARGDYDEAEAQLQRTLALSREIGDRYKTAVVLGNLGSIAGSKSDFDDAYRYFEESLALCRSLGNRQGEAFALSNLGTIAELREDFPQSMRYLQDAYRLSEQIGNRLNSATTLAGLGAVARLMQETTLAQDYYRKAMVLAAELDAQPIMMDILVGMAQIAAQNEYEKSEAVRWLGLVLSHPATVEDTRKLAEPALAELRSYFGAEDFERLLDQGKTYTITQVARTVSQDS
jgi:serine/threonine protein kinase/tetratricopeptide (TPR) repeat protein